MEDSSSATDYCSTNEEEEEEEEEESSWTMYLVDFLINGQEKGTPSSHQASASSPVDRVDDALEDTASSPLHTPKEEDKGISSGDEVPVGRGGGGDSRLLKERGLCSVPWSMVANDLG